MKHLLCGWHCDLCWRHGKEQIPYHQGAQSQLVETNRMTHRVKGTRVDVSPGCPRSTWTKHLFPQVLNVKNGLRGHRDLKDKWELTKWRGRAESARYSLSPLQNLPCCSGKPLPREILSSRNSCASGVTWEHGCQKCYYLVVNHILTVLLKLQRVINWLWFLLGKTSKKPLYSSFFL